MIRFAAVLAEFHDLPEQELADWIARGWIRPERDAGGEYVFEPVDMARVALVRDLRLRAAFEAEALPVVLSLIDQVYDLRRALRRMARALQDEPEGLRATVLDAIASDGHRGES